MTQYLKDDSKLIKRSSMLDALNALYLTQSKFNRLLKEDSYACGYCEGFEDALLSIAQVVGVSEEFDRIRHNLSFDQKNISFPIPNGDAVR